MTEQSAAYKTELSINREDRVRVPSRPDLGLGEVLRISDIAGIYQADVVFETTEGRRLETIPLELLAKSGDMWDRLKNGDFDDKDDYTLKQMAYELIYSNSGGELTASRVNLLPHQILLVHELVAMEDRRLLIADEVGLGKTIEVGMALRELIARGESERILIVTPAGLVKNWQHELESCFRLYFEILGLDFSDFGSATWENHDRVIASIDTLKVPRRVQRLLAAPPWDVVVFDEAHHLSRKKRGKKKTVTQNYKLAEMLKEHTRDLLFLSATPHQGDPYQFWSMIQLLNDQLFATPDALPNHRGLLGRVMTRRTKREVTDAEGNPIFRRRQVHTEPFSLAPKERYFYDKLSDYLREGYNAAGIHQKRTTRQQRAIGFVMATFQKIMSSSSRAIHNALRRRLLVLLTRKQLELETKRRKGLQVAEDIMAIQDEMLNLAGQIIGSTDSEECEAYVLRIRHRLLKKIKETYETTEWSLEADEEAEEGAFAEADIPNEIEKVRELISLVPTGTDRRFDTLVRAISDLSRTNPKERFIIFTQYRDTLEFLRDELGNIFGHERIATIKGGPLEDKIAAVESFWTEDGARFLISTSAGGEGINLQVGRILFNYDLPWNPMAVEQRVGRVHRYGQQKTVQAYNLIAEDTVEERIYTLLGKKLREIATTIGKVDKEGHPMEDFRSEILGFLGSRPDYLELYKRALVDTNYEWTEAEMQRMLEDALRAREALASLTQDLTSFNLEHFKKIEGRYTLSEMGEWVRQAVLRLGGAAMPDGDFWSFLPPESLQRNYHLMPRYEGVCFDRDLATRTRNCEIGGIGHPMVDALMEEIRRAAFQGSVFGHKSAKKLFAHYSVRRQDEKGHVRGRLFNLRYDVQEKSVQLLKRFDLPEEQNVNEPPMSLEVKEAKERIEAALQQEIVKWLPERQARAGLQLTLVGLHFE